MRFVITGEWNRNRLLQTIIGLYSLYVMGLWVTNILLFFNKMSLSYTSVVEYYLGSEERYLSPRSYQGLLEVSMSPLGIVGSLDNTIYGLRLPYFFESMAEVDKALYEGGMLEKINAGTTSHGVRVLADGELKAKVTFEVAGVSKSAVDKIEKAGGSVTVLVAKAAAE